MVQLQPWLCLSIIFFSTRPAYPVSSTKQNLSNAVAPTISMAPTVPRYSDDRSSSGPEDQARPMPQSSSSSSSSWWGRKVLEAALITAAITLVIAGIIFFFCCRHLNNQRKNTLDNSLEEEAAVTSKGVRKVGNKVKGVIVNDNGRDIIYIKDSEGRKLKTSFSKHTPNRRYGNEKKRMDEALERPRRNKPREVLLRDQSVAIGPRTVKDPLLPITQTPPTPPRSPMRVIAPPSPPAPPIPPPPHPSPLPPPLTPPPPPPPPPLPPAPPLPPPSNTEKRNSTQPPLPSRAGGLVAAPKPPPAPRGKPTTKSMAWPSGENLEETSVYNTKLKPLFWDKVNANTDHSVVWDLINDGSLRFEDDMIETLFYYTNAGLEPPQREGSSSRTSTSTSTSTAQVFVLEPRRSQNTAIVLKSLAISRKEILDAILEGHGLTTDILEKLVRISPTEEEKSKILQFTGNPTKLAVAESFLFYILKAVPSAFIRINAMLFRSNYYTEILQLKEYLQTLELGCKELRTHGLFLKLLEAILKAGNKMNAGTSRGNALGFHLTALRKLSDVKSTDGKTTLLHFVVEQVVRSEGKRCILNGEETLDGKQRNRSLKSDTTAEERNKEYLLLGLPAVVKLSVEYANVKKAATVDHDNFINTCSSLSGRLAEIQQLVTSCGNGEEESALVREMKGFLQESDVELRVMKEEQARVLELVRRTTDYYQVGSSKPKRACQLQLFIIVKDFLEMVDQACIDISKKLETKSIAASKGSSSQQPRPSSVRFPDFRLHLMSDMSGSTSFSDSDDEL